MEELSRRCALQLGAAALAANMVGGAEAASEPAPAWPLRAADYGEVTLAEGPMRAQFRATHAALMGMNEDALLKPFRQKAGLAAPGPDMGGWYNYSAAFNPPADMHGYIPGHCFGQYLSSLSRAYAVTGDVRTRAKAMRLVAGFSPTVTSAFYDGYPLPAYTFDKTNIGLIDAHQFAGDTTALAVLNRALDAVLPHLEGRAMDRAEMRARPHPNVAYTWDETYTVPENFYLAYSRGAGQRWRDMAAKYLLDKDYFDPLANNQNVLPGRHAYSHVNALNSAMQAWKVDGSAKHFTAAKNGMNFVLAQSFATGGWGPNETFVVPGSGQLGDSLSKTHSSFETACGAYGHFKIGRYLIAATGDSRWGDSMERILYNTILGALPLKSDGNSFYYADYNSKGSKNYYPLKCSCCSGTIGQVTADYGISSYFAGGNDVFVNLYSPSAFTVKRNGNTVRLAQATRYPLTPDIAIAVSAEKPENFAIGLRIPAWAGPATKVSVNGEPAGGVTPGQFLRLARTWKDGDRIAISFDMPIRLEAVDEQHPDALAVMQGPLALFAVGDQMLPFDRQALMAVRQIEPGAPEWQVTTGDGRQRFKPYFAIGTEDTRLYQTGVV